MWPIIVTALINLLIYFFEKWWTNSNPYPPSMYRGAFLDEVSSIKWFWMGTSRVKYAGLLFDKYQANYDADKPPGVCFGVPLPKEAASMYAKKYAIGLTLSPTEVVRDKGKGLR